VRDPLERRWTTEWFVLLVVMPLALAVAVAFAWQEWTLIMPMALFYLLGWHGHAYHLATEGLIRAWRELMRKRP
jgi:hypothetical protein